MRVTESFQVADSRNLPKVSYIMLLEYMHENDCYNAAETRSAKALLASRDSYVDTAVGYVEIKRDGNSCVVQGRVTPEHKVKAKLYMVTAVIDESHENITKLECHDCAASAGGCKHAICFAMWLIKRSDEPSVTSTTCYWTKPKLAGSVDGRNFILAKDIGKKKRAQQSINMTVNLEKFSEECKKRKMDTGMILNYCGNQKPTLNDYNIFNLMLDFCQQINDQTFEKFYQYCVNIIDQTTISKITEATKGQASSKLWHSMRQGRITGSKLYEATHCSKENGSLVQSILGGYKVPETKAIKRGKVLEKEVLKQLENMYGVIETTGFILVSPIIGVSPDGLCKDFVIEIKCPMSNKTLKNYVKDGEVMGKCKAQLMLQMHATSKRKGLLCVADPSFEITKLIHEYWIDYDGDYVNKLLIDAEKFWIQFIFNKIKD